MSEGKTLALKPKRRYALYVRVSDGKQLVGLEYNSLKSQEDILRRWVAELPNVLGKVYRVYSDIESGTKIQRDGLIELIADARAGKFDEAVAYNSDRWCRNMEIHIEIKRITRECGVRFTSATQDFGDEPEGRLLDHQIAGINEFYSALIGKKEKAKRLARLERGE